MAMRRNLTLSVAGGACLLWLATPAIAQEAEIIVTANMKVPEGFETVKLLVNINDLDLSKPVGTDKLEKRVSMVIKRFCGPPPRAARWQVADSKVCSDFAWASAKPQMQEAVRKARGS